MTHLPCFFLFHQYPAGPPYYDITGPQCQHQDNNLSFRWKITSLCSKHTNLYITVHISRLYLINEHVI